MNALNKIARSILTSAHNFIQKDPNEFLKSAKGVIHVGANAGQERKLYAKYQLPVIWIEPIPEVYETLKANIQGFQGQRAIQGLVTDTNNQVYPFHIATNNGASSSIYDMELHKDIWPDVKFEKTIQIHSKTLPSLLQENQVKPADYVSLILDTQGSELLVLKGAASILQHFTYIKTEAADFESYKGCCQLKDIEAFLVSFGFQEYIRSKFNKHPNGGSYYDVVYKNLNR